MLVETRWRGAPRDVDAGDTYFWRALEKNARNARQLAMWHGVFRTNTPTLRLRSLSGARCARACEHSVRRRDSGVVVMSGDHLRTAG